MMSYSAEQLNKMISRDYGFQRDRITEARICGLWEVRFNVNGILYYGTIPFSGALPTLKVDDRETYLNDEFIRMNEEYRLLQSNHLRDETSTKRMEETQKVRQNICNDYGFLYDKIEKVKICGLQSVRFEVNGIQFYGASFFQNKQPYLMVEGYSTPYYEHDTPVTEEYYNKYIKGKKVVINHCIDRDSGDYEVTGIFFSDQKKAQEYIDKQEYPRDFDYEICD